VQKWWSILFGATMAATVVLWAVSPAMGWWLPQNISTFGDEIDYLFYLILAITGFFFILTEAVLVYFMFKYAGVPQARKLPMMSHGSERRLELAWSIVPAAILLYIAIAQVSAWAEIKYRSRMPGPNGQTQQMEVSARQFEWRIRYPSPERMKSWESNPPLAEDFAHNPHEDDIWVVNQVHVWKNNKVLVHLGTRDVLHSFYQRELRLKQDAVPGKTIRVWFEATKANTKKYGDRWLDGGGLKDDGDPRDPAEVWEIACAELCGWGHAKMVGRLYVHETKDDFLAWLRSAQADQRRTTPTESTLTARIED
jgi:cytochrome c oxidase subunit 2